MGNNTLSKEKSPYGLNQEIAAIIGCSANYVSRVLLGKTKDTGKTALKVKEAAQKIAERQSELREQLNTSTNN